MNASRQERAETEASPQLVIVGHHGKIDTVAFSADGKFLISQSGETIIWNVKTGKCLRVMTEEELESGLYLLEDKLARTGKAKFKAMLAKRGWVQVRPGQTCVSPDGAKVAGFASYSPQRETKLVVWERQTGKTLWAGCYAENCSLTFSTDGELLALTRYGWQGAPASLWNLRTDTWKSVLPDKAIHLCRVSMTPDIRMVAVSMDGKEMWDAETERLLYSFRGEKDDFIHPFLTESIPVGVLNKPLSLSPDGKWIALERGQGIVTVREWETSQMLSWQTQSPRVYPWLTEASRGDLRTVAFSPDGHTLATGGDDHLIHLWDARTGELLNILGRNRLVIEAIAFAPDGKSLTALSDDGIARVWNLDEAKQSEEASHHFRAWAAAHVWTADRSGLTPAIEVPEDSKIVAISLDGKRVVVQSKDEALSLWERSSRNPIATLPEGGPWPLCAFSPDSRFLAVGGDRQPFYLFDLNAAGVSHQLARDVRRAVFSPDGRLLAIEHEKGMISIWDVRTVTRTQVVCSAEEGEAYMALSPDGRTLALGDYYFDEEIVWLQHLQQDEETFLPSLLLTDAEVYLLHMESQAPRKPLKGHQGQVRAAAFSPEGTRLATGGTDGTIHLWNVADTELLATLLPLPNKEWIIFTPEGRYAASPGADTYIRWRTRDALLPAHTYAQEHQTLEHL